MEKSVVLNTVVSATIGGILGGVVTYLSVKRTFDLRLDQEVANVKRHYALIRKDPETVKIFGNSENQPPTDPIGEVVEQGRAFIQDLGYSGSSEESDEPDSDGDQPEEDTVFNAFDIKDSTEETYEKIEGAPYIISSEDFYNSENDFDKITVSYYEGDDTLVDEREQPINDPEPVVGNRHLSMFGFKSDDPNIVYVRNERLSTDFEIMYEEGEYAVRVLGIEKEVLGLKEPKPRPRRMRDDD